jgi:hypothetical protein
MICRSADPRHSLNERVRPAHRAPADTEVGTQLTSGTKRMAKENIAIPNEQKVFRHANLRLERFAESLFGQKYHKSMDRVDIGFWKSFYVKTFEVLQNSIASSIGSIDKSHNQAIQQEVASGLEWIRRLKVKDELHGALIVTLFRLVFLLLGRLPYREKGKRRSFSTFRTVTYSQTHEQLSWLLQGYMQRHASEHGFGDSFDADYAFLQWARKNKRQRSDRSAYVEWVRLNFPETYAKFA